MISNKRTRSGTTTATNHITKRIRYVYKDIGELNPYVNNPRDNAKAIEAVANSISSFGFLVPIVIDSDGVIAAGHTRYAAAVTLGMTEVPCILADHLSTDQLDAFRVIDNKVSELATWDFDKLSPEITRLSDSGIEFTRFGWTQEEIDCLGDVVRDDCMSAGSVTGLENSNNRRRVEQRAPNRARIVIGEFVLFIPQSVYRRWAAEIRTTCNYEEAAINSHLKRILGITPYEEAEREQ